MAHPVPTNVRTAYISGLRRLLTLPLAPSAAIEGKPGQWKLHLSPKAYASWKEFQRAVETLMREGGTLFHLKDWASKLPGAAARIAAIMHCVCVDPRESSVIEVNLMECALSLAAALIDQALAVFDLMQRDPVVEDAQRILRWIRRQERTQFTARDCFCAHQGHFRKVDSMYPAIHLLEQHGYLRQAHEAKPKGRPSAVYLVNPKLNEVVA
jgi:putative DNA primase/helicase